MTWKLAIAALGSVLVAACSNAPESEVTGTRLLGGLLSPRKEAPHPSQQELAAQTAAALANTSAPLILVNIPKRNAATVMQQIETNGAYATYGTSDRRSVTLRNGLLTATRGLGNDLMSSDVFAVQALISARKAGSAPPVKRYLDGENLTVARVARCSVSIGETSRMQVAEINAGVTRVTERCAGDQLDFTNSYLVDGTGQILQSKQWISPLNGYIVIQQLRR
ncbi:YjbF family lipoprotein [Roseovarius sp. SCSIO 43702]|uniref:YjbF family lipoprotein n=1 Tax=Roseovarius sp. SCSIO 43702 TaxID=2823043 RepID=UPI001C72BDBC|nr:YjbF family lipoprotein [Roseovarius sp. SCSIO 43702]QYX57109.1 YjbF family lipoprotein [Roseovarius sp. SCSIO 43702]